MSLMQKHGLPELLARILAARGVALDDADGFLNPSLKTALPDPSHFLDMDAAAERIAAAIIAGERMVIFGDYDVDGATSSALLLRYFRALGAEPLVHIPDRMKEGYGPNTPALLSLKERGASVIITVDCGTLSFEPLAAAHAAGLDVIVIDHHIGGAQKPQAYAIVNPNRLDETSPHRQLAAVGVAFMLVIAVNRLLRARGFFNPLGISEPNPLQWLDLVALGTICDVVPLTGVNRALVAQGLKIMAARGNLGMRTVLDLAKIDEKPGVYHAGFVIGPRINAGGRVGRSDLGVRLLSTEDEAEALTLARELDQHNAERKSIESLVLEEAMRQAEAVPADVPFLLLAAKGWHQGVIGIVAGRVKERFHKPTAVVAIDNGIGKASARSVPGVDIGAAIIAAREAGLLLAGGGHAMAAGFTVEEAQLPALAEFLSRRAAPMLQEISLQRRLKLDGMASISGATPDMVAQIERIGPFGQGNPSIRLAIQNVINLKPEPVGDSHVKTLFIDHLSNARLSAIAFRVAGTTLGDALLTTRGKKVTVAGQLRLQEWNGRQTVSLLIDDICAE
jgi:single-stranded-DNA-specific exonuclease